jgi:exosortase
LSNFNHASQAVITSYAKVAQRRNRFLHYDTEKNGVRAEMTKAPPLKLPAFGNANRLSRHQLDRLDQNSDLIVDEPQPSDTNIMPPQKTLGQISFFVAGAGFILIACIWSYWRTLINLIESWDRIPDYSHGYLVIPLAAIILWVRRNQFPGVKKGLSLGGLALILLSIAIRYMGAKFYLGGVDGWSILLWCAGTVWFLGGWAVLWWSMPSIVFLFFMIPLPFGVERWLSLPLQRIATMLSCWTLQLFGQPALAEGNTIWLNNINLEVEQACSGLRIFMGILALAFAYLNLVRRSRWEQVLLLASVIPVALAANCARIVTTGLLYQYVSDAAAKRFAHDFAGWAMIPLAAGLFALVLWYVSALFREEEELDMRMIVQMEKSS